MTSPPQKSLQSSTPLRVTRARLPSAEIAALVSDCADDLKALDGGSLLLTGATGWFGTWILDVLLAAREQLKIRLEVNALSRDPGAFLARNPGFDGASGLRWQCGDVRALAPSSFDYAIHGATDSGRNAARVTPQDMFETVLHGTERALAAAGKGCRGFLLFSSGAIYGPHPSLSSYQEEMLLGPDPTSIRSSYAEAKRAAETACAIAAQSGVAVRIARCFAFVGPHMPFDRHFAIGNFIADAVTGRQIRVRSDGSPVRSYLYMSDLVRASLGILIRGKIARPYNVGSDSACTVGELAKHVNFLLNGAGVLIEDTEGSATNRYVPNIERIRGELDFQPKVLLGEAILKTAAWYRTQVQYAV